MGAPADLPREDEAPPPSGVRVRRGVVVSLRAPRRRRPDVLADVAEEVFFEVLSLIYALSPLQGPWLRLALPQLGGALLTLASWHEPEKALRDRWPELVPGTAALDRLAGLMVDTLCG